MSNNMQLLQTHVMLLALMYGATGVHGLKCYVGGGLSAASVDISDTKTCSGTGETKCKNETRFAGTTYSCATADQCTGTTGTPNCKGTAGLTDVKTCCCNEENCNKGNSTISCYVGIGPAKVKTACQAGIMNCKKTAIGISVAKVHTYYCGNTNKDQTLNCNETETLTEVCFCKGDVCNFGQKSATANFAIMILGMFLFAFASSSSTTIMQ